MPTAAPEYGDVTDSVADVELNRTATLRTALHDVEGPCATSPAAPRVVAAKNINNQRCVRRSKPP